MLKIILQLLLIILIFSCQKQQVPSVVTIKVPEIAMDDDERNRGHCDLYPFVNDGRMFD